MSKRIQFVSVQLVNQIIAGKKKASVVSLDTVNIDEDKYNHALIVGEYYDVYDSKLMKRCIIRITVMELCRWNDIPERLWRGESNASADEFRKDHKNYFNNPSDDFEFIAYYFHRIK
jgi:uncharacterized protein YhfF